MLRARIRENLGYVGQALREPEAFALAWHRQTARYDWSVFAALGCTAVLGTATYGLIMGMPDGVGAMFRDARLLTLGAGIAWSLPLPALYILNSLSGSRLKPGTTLLAALVTTSWGGLAMLAGIPIAWFFTLAIPHPAVILLVHVAVFAAVGVAMTDVFSRTMAKLEPWRGRLPAWWLLLVGLLGGELFYALGLFDLSFLFRS
jgi:hypothetical protein